MAKEDFCFTFYDGDATRDASHMNRLERGAYYDLIIAQRKFGRLSIDQIKKVLGKDFDDVWPALELSLLLADGFYYIEWIENSLEKSRKHSLRQSKNGQNGGRPPKNKPKQNPDETQIKANLNPTESQKKPLGTGDGNEEGDIDFGKSENLFNPHSLVGEMAGRFKAENQGYFFDNDKDPAAIAEIAGKIHKWKSMSGYFTDTKNAEEIKLRWGEIIIHVKADSHLSKYSLVQINKHFSSITQSLSNGRNAACKQPDTGKPSKPGTGASRIQKLRDLREQVLAGAPTPKGGE